MTGKELLQKLQELPEEDLEKEIKAEGCQMCYHEITEVTSQIGLAGSILVIGITE